MSEVVLNLYVDDVSKGQVQLYSTDNANNILGAIGDKVTSLKVDGTLKPNMILNKVVAMPKSVAMPKPEPGIFDYFKSEPKSQPKSEHVDLMKLYKMVGPDNLKNLSVEPTIDVYLKEPSLGGRRKRKSRKTRKNKRV